VFFRVFRLIFLYLFDTISAWSSKPKGSRDLLLVRVDAIGDFVLWLDAAKEYRRLYPGKKITLCTGIAQSELAGCLPYWDEVWSVDVSLLVRSPVYRLSILKKIRCAGFDIAIQPTYSRVFLLGDFLIRASGSKQRIGSVGDVTNQRSFVKRVSDRWYTKLIPGDSSNLMELERNAEFVRKLSEQDFFTSLPIFPDIKTLPERLKVRQPYVVVFPGASWSGRQWPVANFVEVVKQIHRQFGVLCVVCGGSIDRALCQEIVDMNPEASVNLGGETSLFELSGLLRGAELLVSNETSALHLAAAVSTPAVGIVGGGHFGRFLPYPNTISGIKPIVVNHKMPCYQCNWICSQPHSPGTAVPCISGITVENVVSAVRAELTKTLRMSESKDVGFTAVGTHEVAD
jgi:ADP-heptose:LPS heptosyltransferase